MAMSDRFADIAALLSGQPANRPAIQTRPAASDPKKKGEITPPRRVEAASPGAAAAAAVPAAASAELKPIADEQIWNRVLEVASTSIGDKARTEHLVFESFDGTTLRLSIDESGADIARYLSRETDRIAELVKRATGRGVRIELDTTRAAPATSATDSATGNHGQAPPLVQKAMELFDATLISVDDVRS
jgi:hypothetical protein